MRRTSLSSKEESDSEPQDLLFVILSKLSKSGSSKHGGDLIMSTEREIVRGLQSIRRTNG